MPSGIRLDPFKDIIGVVWGGAYQMELLIRHERFAQIPDHDSCLRHVVKVYVGIDPEVKLNWTEDNDFLGGHAEQTALADALKNKTNIRIEMYARGGHQDLGNGWVTLFPDGSVPGNARWTFSLLIKKMGNQETVIDYTSGEKFVPKNDGELLELGAASSPTLTWYKTICAIRWDAVTGNATLSIGNAVGPVDAPT